MHVEVENHFMLVCFTLDWRPADLTCVNLTVERHEHLSSDGNHKAGIYVQGGHRDSIHTYIK